MVKKSLNIRMHCIDQIVTSTHIMLITTWIWDVPMEDIILKNRIFTVETDDSEGADINYPSARFVSITYKTT